MGDATAAGAKQWVTPRLLGLLNGRRRFCWGGAMGDATAAGAKQWVTPLLLGRSNG